MSYSCTRGPMSDTAPLPTCGIIMPISYVDEDHTEAHWGRVKQVFCQAIEQAGMTPKPVWEGGRHDVIQSRILENIFENEIVLCDISTKNPNVMLEWGMRLTTKRPTIAVAERGTELPFDTSNINTWFYDPSLEWNSTQVFIGEISVAVKEILSAYKNEKYNSFLENFKFEKVDPKIVTVPADRIVLDRIEAMDARIMRISSSVDMLAMSIKRSNQIAAMQRNNIDQKGDVSDLTAKEYKILADLERNRKNKEGG